jgi:hypothetical protein
LTLERFLGLASVHDKTSDADPVSRLRSQDFSLPVFIHETEPPGVTVMKARRAEMTFRFEELPTGGKVVIRTNDAQALGALHEFLRFQIREHRTGDPMEVR